jgi:hypothetical protein
MHTALTTGVIQGRMVKISCPRALTEHHAMKAYWGRRSIEPRILDVGTRWR